MSSCSTAAMPPPNYLPALTGPPSGFTVIGAGKTAMDTALWLLDQGVAPESIRWIRPRDAWLTERGCVQPLDLAVQSMVWAARTLEASAQARDMADLFRRLQEAGCSRRSTRR